MRIFEFSREVAEAGSQSSAEYLASFLDRGNPRES